MQPNIYRICSKVNQFIYTLVRNYIYAKYQDPSQSGSSDTCILFLRLFLYKMPVSEKGE